MQNKRGKVDHDAQTCKTFPEMYNYQSESHHSQKENKQRWKEPKSPQDNVDVHRDLKKENRKCLRDNPTSVTYDGFWSLKNGRNQARS